MKKHNFIPDQHGEIIVTGTNKLEIPLRSVEPSEIFLCFKDEQDLATCAPNQYDEYEWELHYKYSHYVLVVKWTVSGQREIFWAVKY